jgi:glycosyltransferase 2 family protein
MPEALELRIMRVKKIILSTVLKFSVVTALIWWMLATDKLSFRDMALVLERPEALVASVSVWLCGPVLLGTLRWWLLIRGASLDCTYGRALILQLTGFFFNTAMPGAVGGDIVKAIYIVRDQPVATRKTPAMLTVLLDRVVGLMGLFVMGIFAALGSYDKLAAHETTNQLLVGLASIATLSGIFLALVFTRHKDGKDPFLKLFSINWPGFRTLRGIYEALRAYRHQPLLIISTIGISVVIQFFLMMFMGFIGKVLYGSSFDASLLAVVFPFGTLVTAIPLAPGGLGVGHAAFDRLFSLVGLQGGANVFNIYVVSQLLLNLSGFMPYLSLKTKTRNKTTPANYDAIG